MYTHGWKIINFGSDSEADDIIGCKGMVCEEERNFVSKGEMDAAVVD